jgi:hypothetical protein
MKEKRMSSKTKAHTRYRNEEGKIVPSVTTIIGSNLGWNKGPLIAWARREALAGNDPEKQKDEAADIGTLAHALIEEYITDKAPHLEIVPVDRDLYSPHNLEQAENAFDAFKVWEEKYNVDITDERTRSEERLVSEWFQYGGTLDLIAPIDGVLSLIDFKSTNAVYPEHRIQLAAYQWLYEEHYGISPPTHLLQIGKEEPTFHHYQYPDLSSEFAVFKALIHINGLRKQIK